MRNKTATIINTGTTASLHEPDIYIIKDSNVKVPLGAQVMQQANLCVYSEGEELEGAKRYSFAGGFEKSEKLNQPIKMSTKDRHFNEDIMSICEDLKYSFMEGALYTSRYKMEIIKSDLEMMRLSNFTFIDMEFAELKKCDNNCVCVRAKAESLQFNQSGNKELKHQTRIEAIRKLGVIMRYYLLGKKHA